MTTTQLPARIAVIGGGRNDEHEISLASAAAVSRAVRALGLTIDALTIDRDGSWLDDSGQTLSPAQAVRRITDCDVAFPALHGIHGEDGEIAGLLEMCTVPFVGSPVRASAIGMDKWVMKMVAESAGIATTPGILADARLDARLIEARMTAPFVVKPTSGGSSNGVAVAGDHRELPSAIAHAKRYGSAVLIEEFVEGHEVDIAVLRDAHGVLRLGSTLSIGVAKGGLFGREEKYSGNASFEVPAPIDADSARRIESAASVLYQALDCSGVARFDFFLTDTDLFLNEVNTAPGMTEHSQVPLMYAEIGLDYVELIGVLIEAAWSSHELRR